MPRLSLLARYYRKPLKVMIVESIVFLSAFVMMAHLSVNFWDRYVIQHEISNLKANLYSMKEAINQINVNYDHLNKELDSIVEDATPVIKPAITYRQHMAEPIQFKRNMKIGKIIQKDELIQAMVASNTDIIGWMGDSSSAVSKPICVGCTILHKNATTLTKYPLKSTSAGSSFVRELEEFEETTCFKDNCCNLVKKY